MRRVAYRAIDVPLTRLTPRLAATGLVILTASLLYQPGPTEATAITYGCAVTVLALLLTEWRPARR